MLGYANDNLVLPASNIFKILTCYAILHRRITNVNVFPTANSWTVREASAYRNNYILLLIKHLLKIQHKN
jgi:hypothetical protein